MRRRRIAAVVFAGALVAIVAIAPWSSRSSQTARPPEAARTVGGWRWPHAPGPTPLPLERPAARPGTPPPVQGGPEMASWVTPLRGQAGFHDGDDGDAR